MHRGLIYCCLLLICGACNRPTYKTVSGPIILTSKKAIPFYDWVGTYEGTLPGSLCDSIYTQLTIKKNRRYTISRKNIGISKANLQSKGRFEWDRYNDRDIKIKAGNDSLDFGFEPNRIRQLNKQNCPYASYFLSKTKKTITGKYWRPVEILGEKSEQVFTTSTFVFSNGKMSGGLNCGAIEGKYRIRSNNRIAIDSHASEGFLCTNSKENLLETFLQAMKEVKYYKFSGDSLVFTNTEKAELIKFKLLF